MLLLLVLGLLFLFQLTLFHHGGIVSLNMHWMDVFSGLLVKIHVLFFRSIAPLTGIKDIFGSIPHGILLDILERTPEGAFERGRIVLVRRDSNDLYRRFKVHTLDLLVGVATGSNGVAIVRQRLTCCS